MDLTPQVYGPEIANFLRQHFNEDPSQRPELENGFMALRRNENIKLAKLYDLPVDENMRGDRLARVMESHWIQGHFPKPKAARTEIEELKAQVAELTQALLAGKTIIWEELAWPDLRREAKARGVEVTPQMTRDEILAAVHDLEKDDGDGVHVSSGG